MELYKRFGPQEKATFAPGQRPTFYDCGICGHLHPVIWDGDCRDDNNRYSVDELDSEFGAFGWDEVSMEEVL